ncbi:catechol 2,3-dioxygenase-like lactoylglutathione lyase family enzyme [Sphingomicrobium lutaoense]|uniref:Catechol 2,3-dioxygenase-like lactoylglutathione lyase family enzyme n=2 Tax=Sphingomicrobium lutaoense TaxID=515949 RepID=A0A839YX58_9SPHN|nr:catechol 2,3-dioxygenase-like lactoylglutathione lyase family enzyme [Sphingomicrobium lutaoense]
MMFSHMMVGSNDLERSKKFYDATFAAFGGPEGIVDPKGRLVYRHNGAAFLVTRPIDGEPAGCGNGMTIGFAMTPEQADAWWKAGQEAGGTAIEDPPGVRETAGMKLYLAYLRDPDGNKLCALHRM